VQVFVVSKTEHFEVSMRTQMRRNELLLAWSAIGYATRTMIIDRYRHAGGGRERPRSTNLRPHHVNIRVTLERV